MKLYDKRKFVTWFDTLPRDGCSRFALKNYIKLMYLLNKSFFQCKYLQLVNCIIFYQMNQSIKKKK